MRHKPVHRFETDMVGINVVRLLPTQCLDRRVSRPARGGRLRTDGYVLPAGLVPDRNDLDALLRSHHTGTKLGLGLVREAVTDPQRIFLKCQNLSHVTSGS